MNFYFDTYKGVDDAFNFGETKYDWEHRHSGGDYGKAKQVLESLNSEFQQFGWWENASLRDDRDDHHDDIVNDWLALQPHITKTGRESHRIDRRYLSLVDVKRMLDKKFFSTTPEKKKTLKLRPHQEKFVEKILSSWEEWTEFLCFAKCRGGKSIMTLSTIVDAGVKETLIVSRFNSPKQSWFDDCNEFGKFKNIRVVKLNEDNWVNDYKRWADDPDLHIIFWSTVQGLCASKCSRLTKLGKFSSIELIVFDECHIGEDADQFKKVRKKFRDAKCLKVSGTAYDQVWKYPKEHRFVYSYWDEQYYYPGEYPKMNVYTIKFDVAGYREIFGDDPDAFTNIFLPNDDETAFLYPDLVRNFWNKYFTVLGQRHLRHSERIIINRNHIIASLPSVAACRLSVPFISEYAALDVTGISGENSDTINKFVKEHDKTICLTVEANILGVTCEEWDCAVDLWKGEDKKRWTQLGFRGGSGEHKKEWDVVDFAPRRSLKCLQDSLTLAKVENPELLDYEITDFTNVFEWDDKFNQLSQDKVFDILSIDVKEDVQGSFRNLGRSISDERLNQEDFNTVDLGSNKKPQSNTVNDNDTNDKSAKKKVEGFGEKKLTKKEKNANRRKLEQILKSYPLVLAHAAKSGKPIRTTDELFTSEFYEPITQDTQSVVYNLLQTRDMSARDITTIIHQNNPIIDKSVHKDFTKTLDSFRITKATQQVIPLDLLKKLLPKVDEGDYVLIVGDPSGSCCSYAIEHLGVSPSNVWVWEDHPTHKYLIQSVSSEINILNNIEDYTMDKAKTYCIGNPPYSDRVDKEFSNKKEWKKHLFAAMNKAKTTSFVVPASAISPSTHFEKIRPYLSYIKTDVKRYFPGVGSTFVVITVEDTIQDKCLVETDEGSLELTLKDIPILPKVITQENIEYVNSILTGGREWRVKCDYHSAYKNKWEDSEGEIEVLHTSTKSFFTNKDVPINHTIRVAVTKSGKAEFKVVHHQGLSESMIFTDGFETIHEAQKYCDFCNSAEIQKVLELCKFSGWNTKELLKSIP